MSTPIKVVKRKNDECKICGANTLPTKRTVVSNTRGKTKIGNDFQAYCAIDVEETGRRTVYCCRNCKSKLETLKNKINEIRETFIKRLHKPTGESPNPKLKKSRGDSNYDSSSVEDSDKGGTEDSESGQRQALRTVINRKLNFHTDNATSRPVKPPEQKATLSIIAAVLRLRPL